MDRTVQETSVFEGGSRVPPSGRTFLRGSFLSVTAWSDYSAHLTLFSNKYIPRMEVLLKTAPSGERKQTEPFS